jgi:hypothetical protein
MKLFTFSLIAVAVVLTLGCETRNPICSENFCVVGEVFPRSKLDTAVFSEVAVDDTRILAILTGITPVTPPVETPVDDPVSVSMETIVADVTANGSNSEYKEKTVTLTATVEFSFTTQSGDTVITLFTHNDNVSFYVDRVNTVSDPSEMGSHTTYTFTLFIADIIESTTDPGDTLIFSGLIERPTLADIEIEDVTLAEIVSDVAAGGQSYLWKTVRLEATVLSDATLAEGVISLVTGDAGVHFFIIDLSRPEKLDAYRSLLSYTFTLYIENIAEVENEPGVYSITAGIADD